MADTITPERYEIIIRKTHRIAEAVLEESRRHDMIIRFLRRTGTSTVAALCAEVGASRSTTLRDLSALRDDGHVIIAEQGRGGGLYLDPRSVQTTARLSVPEVFALIIGIASMRAAQALPFASLIILPAPIAATATCWRAGAIQNE